MTKRIIPNRITKIDDSDCLEEKKTGYDIISFVFLGDMVQEVTDGWNWFYIGKCFKTQIETRRIRHQSQWNVSPKWMIVLYYSSDVKDIGLAEKDLQDNFEHCFRNLSIHKGSANLDHREAALLGGYVYCLVWNCLYPPFKKHVNKSHKIAFERRQVLRRVIKLAITNYERLNGI